MARDGTVGEKEKGSQNAAAGPFAHNAWSNFKAGLHELNFIQWHYVYFIGTCLLSTLIFWGSSTPFRSVSFVDSLFLCTSAMTLAGLNTVNLSSLNTFQQFILFLLIIMGSAVLVSAFVVHVRKRSFDERLLTEMDRRRRLKRKRSLPGRTLKRVRTLVRSPTQRMDSASRVNPANSSAGVPVRGQFDTRTADDATLDQSETFPAEEEDNLRRLPPHADEDAPTVDNVRDTNRIPQNRITFVPDARATRMSSHVSSPGEHDHYVLEHLIPRHGVGAAPTSRSQSLSVQSALSVEPRPRKDAEADTSAWQYWFFSTGLLGRNSLFHHMSEDDRVRLGGLEYGAVRLLGYLVPAYFIAWQLLGSLALGAYLLNERSGIARRDGLNPFWVGAFNAISAFNNSGMSLLNENMVAFQTSAYMMLSMGLFILAGNTCYPIFLRLICWTMWKLVPPTKRFRNLKKILRFLLDHPRRVYTNMFPSRETWWLAAVVIVLNAIDCAAFVILNIGNGNITRLPPGYEFLAGLFQAFAVRSGGFYVVPISSTRISLQMLYIIMMYIGDFPVVITMRNSNVYEERSLGIYADDPGYEDYEKRHSNRSMLGLLLGRVKAPEKKPATINMGDKAHGAHQRAMFVQQQLRAQLAHDLWWLVLAIWLISIIERSQFDRDPVTFSLFNVVFEVVSGYAVVGISVGVPFAPYSFSGSWRALSKLILCAVMIRGRHRDLPVAIDKAIMLPRDGRAQAGMEEEDAMMRWEKAKVKGSAGEERV